MQPPVADHVSVNCGGGCSSAWQVVSPPRRIRGAYACSAWPSAGPHISLLPQKETVIHLAQTWARRSTSTTLGRTWRWVLGVSSNGSPPAHPWQGCGGLRTSSDTQTRWRTNSQRVTSRPRRATVHELGPCVATATPSPQTSGEVADHD